MNNWPMLEQAKTVIERLRSLSDGKLPPEIMRLDDKTTSLVIDIEGIDYIFSMTVVPKQRPRPTSN